MKKIINSIAFLLISFSTMAQDDLLNMLQNEQPKKPVAVFATFKSTRIITAQSNEHVAAKHLNFVILHRFGAVNEGAYTLYGLDKANMRLVFDYGLTDNIQIGVARSRYGIYDGNLKLKLFKQKKGGMPFSIGYYGNVAINAGPWENPNRANYFSSRLTYFNQIIFAKKFGDRLSLQIAPCVIHQNLVKYTADPNTTYAIGTGGSIKLNRSFRFNFEYYPRLTGQKVLSSSGTKLYDYLALGFDIETGGHVFQVMFCNGEGMLEQQMVLNTQTRWIDGGIRLGFNISRTFSMEGEKKSKKW